jgi:hypothetical protein
VARMLLVRRGRLLSAGGDARTSRETGCAPTEAGAAAERATETRSRPLVTTVRWSRGTACESRLRVREVRAPAGEDVARVADVAGVERLVAPGGRGSARCSSARRTRAVRRVRLRFGCERCRTWPPKKTASSGLEDSSHLKTLVFRSDGAEPVACLVRVVGALDSARAERPRRTGAFAGQRSSPPHLRDAWKPVGYSSKAARPWRGSGSLP